MIKEIRMPDFGTTTSELSIARVRVKVGDRVNRGDVILDVETDKTVMELESFASGILIKLCVSDGDAVSVGDIVAYVGDGFEKPEG